jgi:hypothetical protein
VQVELASIQKQITDPRDDLGLGWSLPESLRDRSGELLERERDLLKYRSQAWFDRVGEFSADMDWEFVRGFVEQVTCTAADWLAHGDAIRARHPVTRVRLTTLPAIDQVGHRPGTGYTYVIRGRERAVVMPYGSVYETTLPELLKLEWPGVTFDLPP